jgi:hypothetical protein
MTARRHHFISQCYLVGFADGLISPKIFVADFKERRTFSTSPANVALERDFHTIDSPGVPPDVVEQKLAEFESDLGPAIRRIVNAGSLADDTDRSVLFFFMALLFIKNPAMRARIGKSMGSLAELMMKAEAANPQVWKAKMDRAKAEGTIPDNADTDAMRKHILEGNFTYGVAVPGHLHLEFNTVDKLLPYFYGRKWTVCKARGDQTAFITSDNPVCLMWDDQKRTEPPGLGRVGTHIVFPVANELAIIGTCEGKDSSIMVDDEFVAIINGNILPFANRQVYARAEDFAYAMPHNGRTMHGNNLLNDPASARNGDFH